ncbi:MAG: indolepyruvate ferredoxin oxidoreductase family protein [Alphaproteobacteria bacterium]|nr:indolepyruvate ferredoxin oxidoreductase family protein [Alphaproteobacteria bacterium]
MYPGARHDGVFAIWYGKGPGLDRSIDAIRHGHMAGAAQHGGVLVVVGDDHPLKETDAPAAHENLFVDLMMPVLYPATVAEVIEYALHGWALSRFHGGWVGLKMIPDTIAATAPVPADAAQQQTIVVPTDVALPDGGLNLRVPDHWQTMEERLRRFKLPAALAYLRANALNKVTQTSDRPRYGIIATGKAWTDVRQALVELGIDTAMARDLGITVLKLAMPYPSDAGGIRAFADGLEEVLVVEEKHRLTEMQVKDALYALPDGRRPRIVGRCDEAGAPLLPDWPEYTPDDVSRALARRIEHFHTSDRIAARLTFLEARAQAKTKRQALSIARQPFFCPGCPHNSSTRVPEGSRAHGGIGCHMLAMYMERDTITYSHMGAEGASWIGQSPFVETRHVFQNIGDGTYYHSGLLAIRACVAAGVNMTFKILFNDAVAMTGGQPFEGPLSPALISKQLHGEGVGRIVVVSDEPDKYPVGTDFAPGVRIEHRRALDRVQRELRDWPGVSALIYDQTCAAEKRRRRKVGRMVDPPRRVLINDLVCEGCGECNTASNCLSVVPVDTVFGRKRKIDQSSCNKDFSCVEAFCPSFVSVFGGDVRRAGAASTPPGHLRSLPEPTRPPLEAGRTYNMLVTGVGGTGVVTITALISMAAHMEGKAFATIDQSGIAQKGGSVISHVRLAADRDDIAAVRLNAGSADLVLGCDSLVTAGDSALDVMAPARTRVLVNTHQQITGDFTRDPDLAFPADTLTDRIVQTTGTGNVASVDATRLAARLLGDSIASNLFMLGYAYQQGLIPVSAEAIDQAIGLNGVAVEVNREAFAWGRRAAVDLAAVEAVAGGHAVTPDLPVTLDEIVTHRATELTAYQDAAYAARYRDMVAAVQEAEAAESPGMTGLAEAVARYAYKLMAYKDEYEVARLYTDGRFEAALAEAFEGEAALRFHLAPPLLSRRDKETGLAAKRNFGPWMLSAMRLLARCKGLRGTVFDVFGYSAERRAERQLVRDYEATVAELIQGLSHDNHALAIEIASVPEKIRGFGHVKDCYLGAARAEWETLMQAWRQPETNKPAAAE